MTDSQGNPSDSDSVNVHNSENYIEISEEHFELIISMGAS